jgi:hypothetical protein
MAAPKSATMQKPPKKPVESSHMKTSAQQPQKRIYRASGTFFEMKIKGPNDEVIGTLTIEPDSLNALIWLRKGKQEVSKRRKTFLNLVDWIESD